MIGVIGIIFSLGLLIFLAYRGYNVIMIAPIMALIAVVLSGGAGLLPSYTHIFMVEMGGYIKTYFPVFMLGAIFGKIMDDSGSAKALAYAIADKLGKDKAIIAVVLSCGILTYGGVSLFVVAFAVYPIAKELYKAADIPKRLIPASIALGAFTFTMTALPGTSQIQNAIPMPFFGTTVWAAPILGIFAGVFEFIAGTAWLIYRSKKAKAAGEGYGQTDNDDGAVTVDRSTLPSPILAVLPIIAVLVINFVLPKIYFNNYSIKILEKFELQIGNVQGMWSLIISLIIAIVLCVILNFKYIKNVKESLNQGTFGSFLAVMNTASEVGYGNVVASLTSFTLVKTALAGISSNPIISTGISVTALAGITGSASGGMSIALGAFGETYLKLAQQLDINPEVLHRVAAIACGGLDSLPHNGAVITLLSITGLTHKESYLDIAVVSVCITLSAMILVMILGSFGIV
jgi:H+/gluconate symporter-like permease